MKIYIIFLVINLTTSCAGSYRQAQYVSGYIKIGMSLGDFKKIAGKKATLEVMEAGYSVYKIHDYDAWTGAIIDTKFYYFNSINEMVKIDGGEFKQKRYQVEVIQRN